MKIGFTIQLATCAGVTLASLIMAHTVSAGECEGILGYVYDKTSSSRSGKHYSSYERFFCSNEYSSYGQARDAGISVGIPIKGVPVEFGGHNRESDWGSYKKSLCDAIHTNNFSSSDVQLAIQKGNKDAIDAWEKCVNSEGLHFYSESDSGDGMQFVLKARYNATGRPYRTTALGPVIFQPSGQVDCKGDSINKGTRIDSGGLLLNCSRTSKAAMTITLSTKNGGGVVKLRATPDSPPDAPLVVITPVNLGSCIGRGGLDNVQLWGPEGEDCSGIKSWGKYLINTMEPKPQQICSCLGHGGVNGTRLWGPEGKPCAGLPVWGNYNQECVPADNLTICGCVGHGNVLEGHILWGPKGKHCGGHNVPHWGRYSQYCVAPK